MTNENTDNAKATTPDVNALLEANKNLETRLTAALNVIESKKGIDPDRYTYYKELAEKGVQKSGNTEDIESFKKTVRTEIENEFGTQITQQKERADKLEKELKQVKIKEKALSPYFKEIADDMIDVVAEKVLRMADLEDGEIVIKDEKGAIRKKSPTQLFTIDDVMAELKTKMPSAFKPDARPGTKTSIGSKTTGTDFSSDNLSIEQIQRIPKEEFNKLPLDVRAKLSKRLLDGK